MSEPSTPYCSATLLNRFMSSAYTTAAADNDADGSADTSVINDALMDATYEIWAACASLYSDSGLAASGQVITWCKYLGAWMLAMNRGNPPPEAWQAEVERIRHKLDRIKAGAFLLTGVSLRADLRPSFSNLRVDRRYPNSTIRVTPSNSTDATTSLTQDETPASQVPVFD